MPTGIYKRTEEGRLNMRKAHLGKNISLETRLKMSSSRKSYLSKYGHPRGTLGKKLTPEHRRKLSASLKGSKSFLCKGGVTPINQIIRQSVEYKLWREAVFKRDNYICQECSATSGNGKAVVLNADHIKPFAYYPELRFAIDNGRTLCVDCHRKTDTYAGKFKKYVIKLNE